MATTHRNQPGGTGHQGNPSVTWMRIALHLSPGGTLIGTPILAWTLLPHLDPATATFIIFGLVLLVTIAAGASDSVLTWKQLHGHDLPGPATVVADTISFVFIQIFLVLAIFSAISLISHWIH